MTHRTGSPADHLHHDHHDTVHDHHDAAHDHDHPAGVRGFLRDLVVPHSHDAADSVDDALEASVRGVRAVKVSLVVLLATAAVQVVVVLASGSVALLADTVHNFSDALTAIPLWVAFVLSRRTATRRYTYGYGRVEDLAGLFIVAMIILSAVLAGVESIRRFVEPSPVANLGWVLAAGLVGFAGNEVVAAYRIRTGRAIGSAALVADGVHARTDGFTSLAVVLGVVGVWAGFPLADPIIGLLISVAILMLLVGTARDIGRRLLDGVDPALVARAEQALRHVDGVDRVEQLQMRWTGHRLNVDATVTAQSDLTLAEFHRLEHDADHELRHTLPNLGTIRLIPAG